MRAAPVFRYFTLFLFLLCTTPLSAQDGGNALRLDNFDYKTGGDFVYFPNHDYGFTDQLTVAAWIRWDSDPNATISNPHEPTQNKWANLVTMDYHDAIGQGPFFLQHNAGNTKFEWGVQSTSTVKSVSSNTSPQQGQWYFLVGVYDGNPAQGTTTLRLYVNGVEEATANNVSGDIIAHHPRMRMNFGRIPSDYRFFNGSFDEVRIWKRALSREEIRKQMRSAATINTLDLVGYFAMNSSAGTAVVDSTGTLSGTFYTALVDVHSTYATVCATVPFTNWTNAAPWQIADADKDWSASNFAGMPTLTVSGAGINQTNSVISNTCNTLTLTRGWAGSGADTIKTPVLDGLAYDTWLGIEDAGQTSQWQASTVPVSSTWAYVTSTTPTSVGTAGSQMQVTITSTPDTTNNLIAAVYGSAADPPVTGETFPVGITGRSPVIWSAAAFGTATATLAFNYAGLSGISDPSTITLMRRTPSGTWSVVPASGLSNNSALRYFTLTGASGSYEYSIGVNLGINPMPVELISFSGSRTPSGVTLRWRTATELHSFAFEVEYRHARSGEWQYLISVPAAGMSTSPRNYTWTHQGAPWRDAEYRLHMVDRDGSAEYSRVLNVNAIATPPGLVAHIYPNPTFGAATLALESRETSSARIRILDMLGRVMETLPGGEIAAGRSLIRLPMENFQPGMYLLEIQASGDRSVHPLRLVR